MKKVEIISYEGTRPKLVGTVYWSPSIGVTCDNLRMRDWLSFGIAVPPDGDLIYADAGEKFFDALKYRYSGLIVARDPVDAVQAGDGRPVESRRGQSPFNHE